MRGGGVVAAPHGNRRPRTEQEIDQSRAPFQLLAELAVAHMVGDPADLLVQVDQAVADGGDLDEPRRHRPVDDRVGAPAVGIVAVVGLGVNDGRCAQVRAAMISGLASSAIERPSRSPCRSGPSSTRRTSPARPAPRRWSSSPRRWRWGTTSPLVVSTKSAVSTRKAPCSSASLAKKSNSGISEGRPTPRRRRRPPRYCSPASCPRHVAADGRGRRRSPARPGRRCPRRRRGPGWPGGPGGRPGEQHDRVHRPGRRPG